MFTNTGTMTATTTIITTSARPKTTAGYIIADLHLAPQRVEALELVGDPVQRLLEAPEPSPPRTTER